MGTEATGIELKPMPLTPKQRVSLDFVEQYITKNGYAPTVQEMADHFGIARNAAVNRLDGLFQKRHIVLYHRIARGIALAPGVVPR